VPFRLLKAFHKIQQRLVRELEKKFSGRDVVIVANRRIMPPPRNGQSAARPRSRTLTAVRQHEWRDKLLYGVLMSAGKLTGHCFLAQVHDAVLDDLVFPTEIVGKRIRYRLDGSKILKVRAAAEEASGQECAAQQTG
jgi:small subunit ribosomal protein S7e